MTRADISLDRGRLYPTKNPKREDILREIEYYKKQIKLNPDSKEANEAMIKSAQAKLAKLKE